MDEALLVGPHDTISALIAETKLSLSPHSVASVLPLEVRTELSPEPQLAGTLIMGLPGL